MKRIAVISFMIVLMALGGAWAQNIELVGSCDIPGWAWRVFVLGNYAYVADYANGLEIIDVSNPTNPILIGNYNTPHQALGVYVVGNYAYIADMQTGLLIINISDPANPILIGTCVLPYYSSSDVSVQENYAYIASSLFGFYIVDIANPEEPNIIGNCNTGAAYGIYVLGTYAYTANYYGYDGECFGRLRIADVSNPENPSMIGTLNTLGMPWDISISGSYAYMGGNSCGLGYSHFWIINVENPAQPRFVTGINFATAPLGIYASASFVYVADSDSGLKIIDVSNPAQPFIAASFDTSGIMRDVYVTGNYIYTTDYNGPANQSSLLILRFNPTGVEEDNSNPKSLSLSQNYPNPFNAQTTISYSLHAQSEVSLNIYDLMGRKIETLLNGHQEAGEHSIIWNAGDTPSGVYFYRLKAGEKIESKRTLLLK